MTTKAAKLATAVGKHVAESIGATRAARPKPADRPEPEAPRSRPRADDRTFRIPLDRLHPDPDQPRKTFDPAGLLDLAESLRARQVQPISVRPMPGRPGHYLIIAGERRYRAAQLAKLPELIGRIADVGEAPDPAAILADQLAENLARADMPPVEAGDGIARYRELAQLSTRDLAARLGISQSRVRDALALAAAPDAVRARVADGRLAANAAVEIARLKSADEQEQLARLAVQDGMTRDQVRDFVKARQEGRISFDPLRGFEADRPRFPALEPAAASRRDSAPALPGMEDTADGASRRDSPEPAPLAAAPAGRVTPTPDPGTKHGAAAIAAGELAYPVESAAEAEARANPHQACRRIPVEGAEVSVRFTAPGKVDLAETRAKLYLAIQAITDAITEDAAAKKEARARRMPA